MNQLTSVFNNGQGSLKTSSKRISEKTGKMHSNVLRDIRNMFEELNLDDSNLNHPHYQIIRDDRNYISEILLNERLSLCLASGYSIGLRMAIIDDWAELKANSNTGYSLPQTHSAALRALAEKIEETEVMQRQLEAQRPAVDFYQAVGCSDDTIEIGQAAKVLNMGLGRNGLFDLLKSKKILMKNNNPFQQYVDRGYFTIIETPYEMKDGTKKIGLKTVVYQKGLEFIKKVIENNLNN